VCIFFLFYIFIYKYGPDDLASSNSRNQKKKLAYYIPDGRGTAAVRAPLVYSSTSTTGTTGAAHVQLFRCCLTRARVASPRLDLISRPES
jgi:alkaline phosphatase